MFFCVLIVYLVVSVAGELLESNTLAHWNSEVCQHFFRTPAVPSSGHAAHQNATTAWNDRSFLFVSSLEAPGEECPQSDWIGRVLTYEDVSVECLHGSTCLAQLPAHVKHPGKTGFRSPMYAAPCDKSHNPLRCHGLPYFIRSPSRAVKVSTAVAGSGQILNPTIWKSASTSIRHILKKDPDFSDFKDANNKTAQGCTHPELLAAGFNNKCHRSTFSEDLAQYTKFAFVREPLSRFLSGVDEHGAFSQDLSLNLRIAKKVAGKMASVFPCNYRRHALATQSYFLSSTDASSNPISWDFVGKVENFERDWGTVRSLVGLESQPRMKLKHINSSGRSELKARYYALAKNDTELMCNVCKIYIQDYACFGYEFPGSCCNCDIPYDLLRRVGCHVNNK